MPGDLNQSILFANQLVFKPQVDWGDKGSTEAGARLANAKVTKAVLAANTLIIF